MTMVSLQPRPGIFTDEAAGASGQPFSYVGGSLVRFYAGRAEQIGGWIKKTSTPFAGMVRALLSSAELNGTRNLFAGSHTALEVLQGGVINDITPISAAAVALGTDPVSTTSGDATVTITGTHGLIVGQRTVLAAASGTVGGLTIDGTWTVATVPGVGSFTFEALAPASSSATGGGASMTSQGLLVPGVADGTFEYGWGVGGYGEGTYGTARSASDIVLQPRVWSLEAYGEDAIAAPGQQGKIYYWDASSGVGVRAAAIAGAPNCNFVIVNPQSRHLIAFGADNDPMLIKWAAQGTTTTWAAAATNDAGDVRLLDGSEVRGAVRTKSEIIVFTDTAAYSLRHIGGAFVFQLSKLASVAPILGQNAAVANDTFVAWMADGQFQVSDGVVRAIPCSVLRHVFDATQGPGINLAQRQKIQAFSNTEFAEVGWFYPSAASDEIDRVVVWSYAEGDNVWWTGELSLTAYIDRSIEVSPSGVDASGFVYDHEMPGAGNDGNPLASYIETGGAFIGEGEDLYAIRQVYPDFKMANANGSNALSFQLFSRMYPQGPETSGVASAVISDTATVNTRITGRQIRWKISANSSQLQYRVGKLRYDVELLGASR